MFEIKIITYVHILSTLFVDFIQVSHRRHVSNPWCINSISRHI
jgi:hypothetical protein